MRKPSGRRSRNWSAQGKSLDEVRAAVDPPPATPPAGGGGRGPGFASYTQVVYTELTKQ